MVFQQLLENYAKLVVKSGVNLQKGQELVISSPIECAPFVRLVAEQAYLAGAEEVIVQWNDEKLARLKYDHCPIEKFQQVPTWMSEFQNGYSRKHAAHLSISASSPDALAGVDPKKPAAWVKAMHQACKEFYDNLDMGVNRWCIVSVPTAGWAVKVFPGIPEEQAIQKLWDAIFTAVRANTPDPVGAWQAHKESFEQKTAFLNQQQLKALRYSNSLGTDITIGLPKNHVWAGGGDKTQDGIYFFPNMPTEEIFCTPHKDKVDGIVYSSMPLNYQGTVINSFSIQFEHGRITKVTAEEGLESLQELIAIDEGSHHLGEVALVPYNSPISNMGLIFYNTLYDENAACHFAIGKGFPECFQDGLSKTMEELKQQGMNDSATHVDFMLGTKDLNITGICQDGSEIMIFKNGNWAF